MNFFKLRYFICFAVLMSLNWQSHAVTNRVNEAIFGTIDHNNPTFQANLPQDTDFFDIELNETVDDDESESEVKNLSAAYFPTTHYAVSDFYYVPKIHTSKTSSLSLFYKSRQSYLQVFRL